MLVGYFVVLYRILYQHEQRLCNDIALQCLRLNIYMRGQLTVEALHIEKQVSLYNIHFCLQVHGVFIGMLERVAKYFRHLLYKAYCQGRLARYHDSKCIEGIKEKMR